MKKNILIMTLVLSQFCFSNDLKLNFSIIKEKNEFCNSILKEIDPLMCCTRRAASGTYGTSGYIQVSVTRCATSTISYQDAQARSCALADSSAKAALAIAADTNESTSIGE